MDETRTLLVAALALALAAACGEDDSSAAEEGPADGADAPPLDVDVTPAEGTARRLTIAQYHNALQDTFGEELVVPTRIEPDVSSEHLLAIGAARSSISPRGTEQYEDGSAVIVEQLIAPGALRDRLVDCEPSADCAREVIAHTGRRLWRRPLTDSELSTLAGIAATGDELLGDFYAGLGYALSGLLQSPHFLFRVDMGEEDPDSPGELRFTSWEMASRLSFLLWNTTPDDTLLDLTEEDALVSDEPLAEAIDEMLDSPRLEDGVRAFFADMLGLAALAELNKDPTIFVRFSSEVGPAAEEETLRTITHHLLELEGDYRDLMTTRRTFIDPRLASIYRVRSPQGDEFSEHEWAETDDRHGLLGHVSVLAANAHATSSSATRRGKFVRERVAEHLENPSCAGCHTFMDPIGLGLENFDGLGTYRTEDNGVEIDASGELDGIPFADAKELGEVLRDHPDVPGCLVQMLYRYATGRVEGSGEQELLGTLTARLESQGHQLGPLLRDVAMSAGFRRVAPAAEGEE
jgi:hypothetical protein